MWRPLTRRTRWHSPLGRILRFPGRPVYWTLDVGPCRRPERYSGCRVQCASFRKPGQEEHEPYAPACAQCRRSAALHPLYCVLQPASLHRTGARRTPQPSPEPSPVAVRPRHFAGAARRALSQPHRPLSLGPDFDGDLLRGLPMSNGLWSMFETIESTAILDRMEGSGLYVGEAGLLGIRGSSWTQASWRLGDLDITDPDRTGTPLFFAEPGSAGRRRDLGGPGSGGREAARGRGSSSSRDGPASAGARRCRPARFPPSLQQSSQPHGSARHRPRQLLRQRRLPRGRPAHQGQARRCSSPATSRAARAVSAPTRASLDGSETGLLAHLVYATSARDEIRFLGGCPGPVPSLRRARPVRRRRRPAVRSPPAWPSRPGSGRERGRGR